MRLRWKLIYSRRRTPRTSSSLQRPGTFAPDGGSLYIPFAMRCSLQHPFAPWRRFAALLMLIATAVAGAELVVPDDCDGDGAALQMMAISADLTSNVPSSPESSHALHLCHSTHTHVGAKTAALKRSGAPASARCAVRLDDSMPAGHVVEPPLRPPAA